MALSHLSISNFRNLVKVELQPISSGFNLFYGQNGSGKTSLLEAIYYLGHRRSFRSQHNDHLIRYGFEQFNIFSKIKDPSGQEQPLGVERNQEGTSRARLGGQDIATISELVNFLPMRLINVHSHYLIEGSPGYRRKYLDWGIFYQSTDFQAIWFRFKRILKQRNAALKSRASMSEIASWTDRFAEIAQSFHELRLGYIESLLPILMGILSDKIADFYDVSELTIDYHAGWDETKNLKELLQLNLPKDVERGYTQYGPHRADLTLKIGAIPAKDVLSTGQQKLLICGMILAQGALLAQQVHRSPLYLVDDLPAELDSDSRHWLIANLLAQQSQVFVTAVEHEGVSEVVNHLSSPIKMFHVKHGLVSEMKEVVV
jgi:DNA replication and repair protein RecF